MMMEEEEEATAAAAAVAAAVVVAAAGNGCAIQLHLGRRGGDRRHAGQGIQRTCDCTDHKQCPAGNREGMQGPGRIGVREDGMREGGVEEYCHVGLTLGRGVRRKGRVGGC